MITFFILLLGFSTLHQSVNGDHLDIFKSDLEQFLQTGQSSENLEIFVTQFDFSDLLNDDQKIPKDADSKCELCNAGIDVMLEARKLGATKEEFVLVGSKLCAWAGLYTEEVCYGILDLNADLLLYIADNKANLTGERVCALALHQYGCPKGDNYEWQLDIPEGTTVEPKKTNSTETFKILQISDIHYDPRYAHGKIIYCDQPLCCQVDQPDPPDDNQTNMCHHWSNYQNSDVPWVTVEELIKKTKTHDFDFVYFTGDIVSHRVWSTTIENNSADISTFLGALRDNYKVPVYPVLGNHEPSPFDVWVDAANVSEISLNWLFELELEEVSQWVSEDTSDTILKGGYYTVSPKPGFRVVVLNSNVCHTSNWWLVYEDVDPYDQLKWLVEVLLEAERNQESVHILFHAPTGDSSCLSVWAREYGRVVERFANTITGQFNGHTHKDQFAVYYKGTNLSEAVGVAFNGGSLTPMADVNPNYKIYEINAETFTVTDSETWTFNLTKANLNSNESPEWYKLYSFRDAYAVDSLETKEIDKLVYKMTQNHTLLSQFNNFRSRNSDPVVQNGCNESCQKSILCTVSVTQYGDNRKCDELQQLYDQNK